MTINEVKRERKNYVRTLAALIKKTDTALEATQRLILRIITRKNKYPEVEDLQTIATLSSKILTALDTFERELAKGYIE